MPPTTKELANQIADIKELLADISKTIAEMQKRPCQIHAHKAKRPFEPIPNTYTLLLDTQPTEDDLLVVGIVHLLPARGKGGAKEVTDASLYQGTDTQAILATLGRCLKAVTTYCPEKLVVYTNSERAANILSHQTVSKGDKKEIKLTKLIIEDLNALRSMFPIEIKRGIPEGHQVEIKSLMSQAELEYIRQKEKYNGPQRTGSDTDS